MVRHSFDPARDLVALLVFASTIMPVRADIVGGGILQQTGNGQFVQLDPSVGFAVGADTFDDDNLYAFDEAQAIVVDQPLFVELGAPDGVIPAGSVVASHYVFFDSVQGSHFGYVEFSTPILGVALTQSSMSATDHLANTTVTYLSPDLRGLETGDEVWIDDEDPHRLHVLWAGSSPGDYIRVFTVSPVTAELM
ncbi:MAG: hypothetical protein KJP02_06855 [Octadecabacter sp.]|nr:hypothetical protein [Octadecabacter sp.]